MSNRETWKISMYTRISLCIQPELYMSNQKSRILFPSSQIARERHVKRSHLSPNRLSINWDSIGNVRPLYRIDHIKSTLLFSQSYICFIIPGLYILSSLLSQPQKVPVYKREKSDFCWSFCIIQRYSSSSSPVTIAWHVFYCQIGILFWFVSLRQLV